MEQDRFFDTDAAIMSSAERDELLDRIAELESRVEEMEKPDNAFWTQLAFDVLVLVAVVVWIVW